MRGEQRTSSHPRMMPYGSRAYSTRDLPSQRHASDSSTSSRTERNPRAPHKWNSDALSTTYSRTTSYPRSNNAVGNSLEDLVSDDSHLDTLVHRRCPGPQVGYREDITCRRHLLADWHQPRVNHFDVSICPPGGRRRRRRANLQLERYPSDLEDESLQLYMPGDDSVESGVVGVSSSSSVPNKRSHGLPTLAAATTDFRKLTKSPSVREVPAELAVRMRPEVETACHLFPPQEVMKAIGGCAPHLMLGQGANGQVFYGQLVCGTDVAVKIMTVKAGSDNSSFESEREILSEYRHPNIVCLLGYSVKDRQQMLIYELLQSGDLSSILHPPADTTKSILPIHPDACTKILKKWKARISVAVDVAQALAFLMNQNPPVFHRDIKAANVLIDQCGRAKLADFGLSARGVYSERRTEKTPTLKVDRSEGTPGYACPEYMRTLHVSEYTEIFSFGMLLLELLTGQFPAKYVSGRRGSKSLELLLHNIDIRDPRTVIAQLDPRCDWDTTTPVPSDVAKLAIMCVDPNPAVRPDTRSVLRVLQSKLRDPVVGCAEGRRTSRSVLH